MRLLKSKTVAFIFLVGTAAFVESWQLRLEALATSQSSSFFRSYYSNLSFNEAQELSLLELKAREKALSYEDLISKSSLQLGMVVSRDAEGKAHDVCDSLLFSSIRYVALRKLGLKDQANAAWDHILQSRDGGKWYRHPLCKTKGTSRDMIVGLIAALTQRPPEYRKLLSELFDYLAANSGYLGDGPFYVSYLSPGIAEVLRHFAIIEGISEDSLPAVIRYGFSTLELDTYLSKVGFQSHLISLVLWSEMELDRQAGISQDIRGIPLPLDRLSRALWGVKIQNERFSWQTQRLVDRDPPNLFFRWLRLSSANALSGKARLTLLRSLGAMMQFPENQLPENCTRKADYLWQRTSKEYALLNSNDCSIRFSGVDYLWMASLLTAPEYKNTSDFQNTLTH